MPDYVSGRFSGARPGRLDRVIQLFVASNLDLPRIERSTILEWITAGLVEVDGNVVRRADFEVRPGSFVKAKGP